MLSSNSVINSQRGVTCSALPAELWREIGGYLHDCSVKPFSQVSRLTYMAVKDLRNTPYHQCFEAFSAQTEHPEKEYEYLGGVFQGDYEFRHMQAPTHSESDTLALERHIVPIVIKQVEASITAYKNNGGLIIIDWGGGVVRTHIAVALAKCGWQPIVQAHENGLQLDLYQTLRAMKTLLTEMKQAKPEITAASPAAMVRINEKGENWILNRECSLTLPTPEIIQSRYNGNVIWISQGCDSHGLSLRDNYTPPFFEQQRKAGITLYQHRIPYPSLSAHGTHWGEARSRLL